MTTPQFDDAAASAAEPAAYPSHDPRTPQVTDVVVDATVRRAPKYGVFLGLGAALGIIVAMILSGGPFGDTSVESATTGLVYSQAQVFGFLALIFVSVGLILGGGVALILDRTIGRRTRAVRVDRQTTRLPD